MNTGDGSRSKCAAGGRFQVPLKAGSSPIVREAHECDQFPWAKLRSMWRLAEVVTGQALLDVGGDANVSTCGETDALEEIDEFHGGIILRPDRDDANRSKWHARLRPRSL